MQIRLAVPDDLARIMQLLHQLNPDDPAPSHAEVEVFAEILASPRFRLIVADDGGILVGTCYLNIIPNLSRGARPYALIENVVTETACRRRGIGSAVIRHALQLAWDANCYKVMLLSGRKEPAIQAFYESCGFVADQKQAYVQRAR